MANPLITKGKIVLVPFPFDDLSAKKLRPAVCLTNPIGPYQHVILAFITSQIPKDLLETDLVIDQSNADFSLTGLHITSTIRLHRLLTVTTSFIKRELGHISSQRLEEMSVKLEKIFHG